jgi:hypothetical protein
MVSVKSGNYLVPTQAGIQKRFEYISTLPPKHKV